MNKTGLWAVLLLGLVMMSGCLGRVAGPEAPRTGVEYGNANASWSMYKSGDSLKIEVYVTGHGNFGASNGWYVTCQFARAEDYPGWTYWLEDHTDLDVPSGAVSYWLATAYTDNLVSNTPTKFGPGTRVKVVLPLSLVPTGSSFWLDVHEITSSHTDGGVPDEWHFVDYTPDGQIGSE